MIFFFPVQPPPPIPTNPVSGPFGTVWVRFGSVSGLFRVRFGVLGGVGVGSGRGVSAREISLLWGFFDFLARGPKYLCSLRDRCQAQKIKIAILARPLEKTIPASEEKHSRLTFAFLI